MRISAIRYLLLILCILILTAVPNVVAQNRSGEYERKDREEYGAYGTLKLRELRQDKTNVIRFDLWIGRTGPTLAYRCTGEIKGIAKWTDSNVAEYNADLNERDPDNGEPVKCHLIFFFSGNRITVRSRDCLDYHGAACDFDGTYIRTRRSNKNSKRSRQGAI